MLEIGSKAPDFTLPNQAGNPVSLGDYRGKKVLLWLFIRTEFYVEEDETNET